MTPCDADACPWFTPGHLPQDLVTLPLEIAAIGAASYGIRAPSTPRWPFENEKAEGVRNPTRQPGVLAFTMGAALMAPLTVRLAATVPRFHLWPQLRGLLHAHLLTELATATAKSTFGRKRPFYDTEARRGRARDDDRKSFFSGHASHSFALATYGIHVTQSYVENPTARWVLSGLFLGTSTWVTASRAIDGQHYWSDVVAGALTGAGIAWFVAGRVEALDESSFEVAVGPGTLGIRLQF